MNWTHDELVAAVEALRPIGAGGDYESGRESVVDEVLSLLRRVGEDPLHVMLRTYEKASAFGGAFDSMVNAAICGHGSYINGKCIYCLSPKVELAARLTEAK